jgi:hypothetical protein
LLYIAYTYTDHFSHQVLVYFVIFPFTRSTPAFFTPHVPRMESKLLKRTPS